ncbi:hypothetical protein MAIT1_01310 [Magnetofaba australis IT-1]|uniref:Uncharacterized protein n=1 Tax=Magnetofaba australis IT-1 TaxID=1434232 RepID=A0A1Y2K086_9PROT|nr:hypothetical protein MAIT1_01310 [Magnetofaba australis IT-1]
MTSGEYQRVAALEQQRKKVGRELRAALSGGLYLSFNRLQSSWRSYRRARCYFEARLAQLEGSRHGPPLMVRNARNASGKLQQDPACLVDLLEQEGRLWLRYREHADRAVNQSEKELTQAKIDRQTSKLLSQEIRQTLDDRGDKALGRIYRATYTSWLNVMAMQCVFEAMLPVVREDELEAAMSPMMDTRCLQNHMQQMVVTLKSYQTRIGALPEKAAESSAPTPPPAQASPPPSKPASNICVMSGLPDEFQLVAAGVYSGGQPASKQLEKGGPVTRQVVVKAHLPDKPVVLALTAYDPVIWRIHRSPQTTIAGVIVSGYSAQSVEGVARDVPVRNVNGPLNERSDCRRFYAYRTDQAESLNARLKTLTGRSMDHFEPGGGSVRSIALGQAEQVPESDWIVGGTGEMPKSGANQAELPAGMAGFEALAARGDLRLATQAEIDAWVNKAQQKRPGVKITHRMRVGNAYMVLKQTTLPNNQRSPSLISGQSGSGIPTLLLPSGAPSPNNRDGIIMLYRMEQGDCVGLLDRACVQRRSAKIVIK